MTVRFTPGSPTPVLTLPNAEGIPVSLSDYPSRAVIIYFYPAATTPGCTIQAVDFIGAHAVLAAASCTIIDISLDTAEKFTRFAAGSEIGLSLLSDPEHEALNAYGASGTRKLYGKEIEGVLRSIFVTDVDAEGNGTVQVAQYNMRATEHVTKLRRELGV